jgi:hypothetical protein
MQTIYKYPFQVDDEVRIEMPENARVLHVGLQGAQPCLWAMVDPENRPVIHRFRVFGTGHPMPTAVGEHVATFQQGPFVWHMFRT